MATYVIGDVHGCYQQLLCLLKAIDFQRGSDRLVFCGDLVNRGPRSLDVLRFVMECPLATMVLGNHDLYLLAVAYHLAPERRSQTMDRLLRSPYSQDVVAWLRHQPLFLSLPEQQAVVVHAGLHYTWSLEDAQSVSDALSEQLLSVEVKDFLHDAMGNTPNRLEPSLTGGDRNRVWVNILTRMRYLDADGGLDFAYSGPLERCPEGLTPWFECQGVYEKSQQLVCFGHWASLQGALQRPYLAGMDGGCVWGGKLMAMRLDDRSLFSVSGHTYHD